MPEETQLLTEEKPLLTIAVPTYNRARFLRELLEVLYDQLVAEPRVELIISDNASPDETPQIVAGYQQRGLTLRSIRNDANIGADGNFLQCFEQARGKYVWIFGDDDLIISGGVAKVLHHLQSSDYDLVYLNSFPLDDTYTPRSVQQSCKAVEIHDGMSYACHVHIFLTFITGNIINKPRTRAQQTSSFAPLIGTNFMQLGWTYTALNGFKRGLFISERLVAARVDNTGGYKLLEAFGPALQAVTEQWLQSEALRHTVYNGTLQRFWPGTLLKYKVQATSFANEADPHTVLGPVYGSNFRYWMFVYPILKLPYGLAKFWLLVDRLVNRIDRALGFPLLRTRG